jgi:hypothetical protein
MTVTFRCPELPAASYLAWGSWWYRVSEDLADLESAKDDLSVVDRPTVWEAILDRVGRDAAEAILHGSGSIAPTVDVEPTEIADAVRQAQARLAWLQRSHLPMLRPDGVEAHVMDALLEAATEACRDVRQSRLP